MLFHTSKLRRAMITGLFCAVALGATVSSAVAQSYPAKPLKLVVPFSAGGTTDLLGRILAQKLGASLGQSVVVENRAGAGSMIGTGFVAQSAPDGYTLLLATSSSLVVAPVFTKAAYDPVKDFAPVSIVASCGRTLQGDCGCRYVARSL